MKDYAFQIFLSLSPPRYSATWKHTLALGSYRHLQMVQGKSLSLLLLSLSLRYSETWKPTQVLSNFRQLQLQMMQGKSLSLFLSLRYRYSKTL